MEIQSLTEALLATQNPQLETRQKAEAYLTELKVTDYRVYILSLVTELATDTKPEDSRQVAGLLLKNSFTATEDERKAELIKKYDQIDEPSKAQLKAAVLQTLVGAPETGPKSQTVARRAAQVVACIGAIDLPRSVWDELLDQLIAFASPKSQPSARVASLEALGYLCEEIDEANLGTLGQGQVDKVMTAVAQNTQQDVPVEVRRVAMRALCNALGFARAFFDVEETSRQDERTFIMEVVCSAANDNDNDIRRAALECVVAIVSEYYAALEPYLNVIFAVSINAVKHSDEEIALQGVEILTSFCEEEIAAMDEIENLVDDDEKASWKQRASMAKIPHFCFIETTLKQIVPVLLELLTKQEEGQEEDPELWNLAKAGATCLGYVAQTARDQIIDLVLPFINEYYVEEDWHFRDAAIVAFGSILVGPSVDRLKNTALHVMQYMLQSLKFPHAAVRDSAAWTVARMCELFYKASAVEVMENQKNLEEILSHLLKSLKDEAHVAEKVLYAIQIIAQGMEDKSQQPSNALSPFFETVIKEIIVSTTRRDVSGGLLRSHAYATLNSLITSAANDTLNVVQLLIPEMLNFLNHSFEMARSSGDVSHYIEIQGPLCGVLQGIIIRLQKNDQYRQQVCAMADQLLSIFIRVLSFQSASVVEEAMLALGSLAECLGKEGRSIMLGYMDQIFPHIKTGLQNFREYQVCKVTVEVIGDLCRILEREIVPYCDDIMTIFRNNVQSAELHRSVKPSIIRAFGEIAVAIEENFSKYLQFAVVVLAEAANFSMRSMRDLDEDMVEYNDELRTAILEAYSGIVQGFLSPKTSQLPEVQILFSSAEVIIPFIASVADADPVDNELMRNSLNTLGDLASSLGQNATVRQMLAPYNESWQYLIQTGVKSNDVMVVQSAQWAQSMLKTLT